MQPIAALSKSRTRHIQGVVAAGVGVGITAGTAVDDLGVCAGETVGPLWVTCAVGVVEVVFGVAVADVMSAEKESRVFVGHVTHGGGKE